MPLQNRVTPFGELVALPGRGTMLGNRGILHDDDRRIVRPWQLRRWITCQLSYRDRRRTVMRPRTWTELFFLDEATAFAAGHRPCAECRRPAYRTFQQRWAAGTGLPTGADAIDFVLHGERRTGRAKQTYDADLATLPDGAFVALEGAGWLVWDRELLEWSDAGYRQRRARPAGGSVAVLTPRSTVAAFAAGYRPGIHPSADVPN
jgi:hypothetical protein